MTLRPGSTSSINLKLQNYGLPPERLALSVGGVPAGWTVTLIGNGQPVAAALPATNASVSLELRLDVPKDAPIGTTNLTVNAKGGAVDASLPVAVTLATDLPAKLTLTPQLPELRGTSKSNFEFQLAIKNESGKKVLVSLSAQAPQNFDATFTEQYGSQEISSIPIEAGQIQARRLRCQQRFRYRGMPYAQRGNLAAIAVVLPFRQGHEAQQRIRHAAAGGQNDAQPQCRQGVENGRHAAEAISVSDARPSELVHDPRIGLAHRNRIEKEP